MTEKIAPPVRRATKKSERGARSYRRVVANDDGAQTYRQLPAIEPETPKSRVRADLPNAVWASRGHTSWQTSTANFGKADCPTCHGIGYLREDLPVGHPRFGRIEPCECRREVVGAAKTDHLPALSNLLTSELSLRLETLAEREAAGPALIEAAREFAEAPGGLLTLWGGASTGQTGALMALVNHFNEQRFGQAYYARFPDLLGLIRRGYHPDADMEDARRYRRLKEIWFLAIDEIDQTAIADWAQEFRARFFDDRYRLARAGLAHTAIALNGDPLSLPADIYDRLRWGAGEPGGFRLVQSGSG